MAGNLMSARLHAEIGGQRMIWFGLSLQVFGSVLTT